MTLIEVFQALKTLNSWHKMAEDDLRSPWKDIKRMHLRHKTWGIVWHDRMINEESLNRYLREKKNV